jgi:hypothetical protein
MGSVSPQQLRGLVDGIVPIIHIKDGISAQHCSSLVHNFQHSHGKHPRIDGVPGDVLGAYHYGKTYDQYIAELEASNVYLQAFLEAGGNPVYRAIDSLRGALFDRNVTVRPATWNNKLAGTARALSWTSHGTFLLEPHDDVGQLTDPRQDGFEAQAAFDKIVIAVNLYPNVPAGGGTLRVWNIIPDRDARITFRTEHTGYPYPMAPLADVKSLDFAPATGSVVFMNGGLVHAVTGYTEGISQSTPRLLINFFAGRIDDKTFVHWV